MPPPPVLIRRARLLDPEAPAGRASRAALQAVLLEGGRIAGTASDSGPRAPAAFGQHLAAGATVLDADGALLLPAFVDAHVHATATGLVLTGLDLAAATGAADLLDRVARAARQLTPGRVLLGHGWDESRWADPRRPTAAELARAAGDAPAYLSRTDLHSALATPALLAGVAHDDGRVRLDAHHTVRARALAAVTAGQARDAQRATRAEAARQGIGCLHEMSGPEVASAADLAGLLELAAAEPGPEVVAYWGALGGHDTAAALGAQPGGDLFVDGSFGSHTAALCSPYADDDTTGTLRYTAGEVAAHVAEATRRGQQAGFHCIGDRAVAAVLDGVEAAAADVGLDAVRASRHRLEHLELLEPAEIARVAALGLVASVQPAFDARWASEMYVSRLGVHRAAATNPFRLLAGAGVPLAFGSDAPVTPLDPWGTVAAATGAQHPVPLDIALAAHTTGGAYAARDPRPGAGTLRAGAPASVALWELPGRVAPRESAWDVAELLLQASSRRCRWLVVGGSVVQCD